MTDQTITAEPTSFWLRDAGGPYRTRKALHGSITADICIVGGGVTGIWTAYELLLDDPTLDIVILEAEYVGYGASGRTAGCVTSQMHGNRKMWVKKGGKQGLDGLVSAMRDAVDHIGTVLENERIDCDFIKSGILTFAENELELERMRAHVQEDYRWGDSEYDSSIVSAEAVRERIGVATALGGHFTPHAGVVHPVKMLRGLAAAVETKGGVIFEGTRVEQIEPHLVRGADFAVRARVVVRATEGYTADLPGLKRVLLPLNAMIASSEPITDQQWRQIGWEGREMIGDSRRIYNSMCRTPAGNINIGVRGVPYMFGSQTGREDQAPAETVQVLERRLAELFPVLEGIRITNSWRGVLGVSRSWAPAVGYDPETGFAWSGGYFSTGLAASNLGARTIRDLLKGEQTALTALPWVGAMPRRWEPEPLRFIGVRGVYGLMGYGDAREQATGKTSIVANLATKIAGM